MLMAAAISGSGMIEASVSFQLIKKPIVKRIVSIYIVESTQCRLLRSPPSWKLLLNHLSPSPSNPRAVLLVKRRRHFQQMAESAWI